MKILKDKYPMGTIPGQQTPGRYINETYYENLKILAKAIKKDMTFLGIITSSTLEVGTGKSVFAQQSSEAYLECIREIHKIDNTLSMQNIVFRPKEIIERSFQVPQYSVIICDEWEDSHYWSELGMTLRQFFRKCRQLNLFIWVIIPNFFQLPGSYAISRSVVLIDVKFTGEFERGYFSYYSFNKKKQLYLKGKKTQDYSCVKPNFTGRFVDGYVVDEELYRREKRKDLEAQEGLEKKAQFNPKQFERELFYKIYKNLGDISIERLSKGFGITSRTAYKWISVIRHNEARGQDMNHERVGALLVYPTSSKEEKNQPMIEPMENIREEQK